MVGMDRWDGRTGTEFVGAGVDVVREASIDVRDVEAAADEALAMG